MKRSWLSLLVCALSLARASAWAQPAPTAPSAAPSPAPTVTWYREVLPIVRTHCQLCHEPTGVAPFPLLTHAQALEHLSEIGEAVRVGYMPPWQPADGCQSFRDARRLTRAETDTLVAWIAQGGPPGQPSDAPPAVKLPTGLSPAHIQLTATPVGAPEEEHTRCYAFSWDSKVDRDVTGYEVQPGGPNVRHVALYTAPELEAQALEAQDPEPGWACSNEPGSVNARLIGVWAPGVDVTRFPAGTGLRLSAGAPIVVQVHSAATRAGERAPGPTIARLQLSPKPVRRVAQLLPLWKSGFTLPSKASGFTLSRTQSAPAQGALLGVFPHMHGLGRRLKLLMGSACAIDIPYWDATGHQAYFFENPEGLPLTFDSRLTLTCTWNNPETRRIPAGESGAGEACLIYLYVAP
jgi:mono/diheme cytochrome c family protein